jgi:hypothetical protein
MSESTIDHRRTIGVGCASPCFATGTRILTSHGEIPVEALRIGDVVIRHDATGAPITWIGRRRLNLINHPAPHTVQPVLIRAGALQDFVPSRDLLLSPDHALLLDGHLIPARTLIGGYAIRQVSRRFVTYFHIELAVHAAVLAEGTPCETYLETGTRNAFEHGDALLVLHPDFAQATRAVEGCAPFAEAGLAVEAVRARILARAPVATTDDAGMLIHRRADGSALITSRSTIPGHRGPDPRDRRELGVKIGTLTIDGAAVALDHPALIEGWHDPEADGRWTDGAALIPADLVAGAATIEVRLAASLTYPITPVCDVGVAGFLAG